jgi:hypothetical protein
VPGAGSSFGSSAADRLVAADQHGPLQRLWPGPERLDILPLGARHLFYVVYFLISMSVWQAGGLFIQEMR